MVWSFMQLKLLQRFFRSFILVIARNVVLPTFFYVLNVLRKAVVYLEITLLFADLESIDLLSIEESLFKIFEGDLELSLCRLIKFFALTLAIATLNIWVSFCLSEKSNFRSRFRNRFIFGLLQDSLSMFWKFFFSVLSWVMNCLFFISFLCLHLNYIIKLLCSFNNNNSFISTLEQNYKRSVIINTFLFQNA